MVMAPPTMCDSAVFPCFSGCLTFLHRHFPPQCPPSHPFNPSLCSQQQPSPWDCSTIPQLQLSATASSRGPASLSRVCMAAARTLILIPFRLPQISCFTLSLKCFSSDSDNCPDVGIRVLPPAKVRSSPTNTPVFLPGSFTLPSFAWFYIFFSAGQVLLFALSWCSACTSVSEGVVLMHPWKEKCSMSTYSSVILFSIFTFFIIR